MSSVATPPYTNNSATYLVPVTILGVVALITVILRVYTRIARTRRLYSDDWLVVAGEVRSQMSGDCLLLTGK